MSGPNRAWAIKTITVSSEALPRLFLGPRLPGQSTPSAEDRFLHFPPGHGPDGERRQSVDLTSSPRRWERRLFAHGSRPSFAVTPQQLRLTKSVAIASFESIISVGAPSSAAIQ